MPLRPAIEKLPHALYRMYNAEDDLLYVGLTWSPSARFPQHRDDKPWWIEVATIRLESFATRAEVDAAEAVAIQAEGPRYNRAPRTPPKITNRRHPQHTFAASDELWEGFGEVAGLLGTDRSKLLNEVMAWFSGEPGARRPRRPPASAFMPPSEHSDGTTT